MENAGTVGVIVTALIVMLGSAGAWFVSRSRGRRGDAGNKPVEKPTPGPPKPPEPAPPAVVDPPTPPPPIDPAPEPEPEPPAPEVEAPPEPIPEPEPEPVPKPPPVVITPPAARRQPFIEIGPTVADTYVDPDHGDDSRDGHDADRPVRSLAHAYNVTKANGVVAVRRGTLHPTSRLMLTKPMTIAGYADERPVIDLTHLSNLVRERGGKGSDLRMFTPKVPGIRLSGFEWANGYGMDGGCIYIDSDIGTVVADMHAHDIDTSIVYVYGGTARIVDAVVWKIGDGHTMGTNVPDGIVVTGKGHDVEIVRPVVFNGPDDGIDLYESHGVNVRDFLIVGSGYYWNGNRGGTSSGDGNGVKLGGARPGTGNNRAIGGIVIGSRSSGVSHNQAPAGNIVVERVTTIRNGGHGIDVGNAVGNAVRASVSHRDAASYYARPPANSEGNAWDLHLVPQFRDEAMWDFGLTNAEGIGASDDAVRLARYWLNQGIRYYAGGA